MFRQHLAFLAVALFFCATPGFGEKAPKSSSRRALDDLDDAVFQPAVITVEQSPAKKVFGSISMSQGSPWCGGRPAYWLVGHDRQETPWCLVSNEKDFTDYDFTNSAWEQSSPAVMDQQDSLNIIDGPKYIDRHDCTALDLNGDRVPDVVCGVGADKGTGNGYNEIFLTGQSGSLTKVVGHGLHKYPTMRNRLMVSLKGANGDKLVFLATRGQKREDKQPNNHRMFRLIDPTNSKDDYLSKINSTLPFFFDEVRPSPWTRYTLASCLQVVDFNNDGLDDILMCNTKSRTWVYLQNADSSWTGMSLKGRRAYNWRNARMSDVTGDGIPDLIVVGWGGRDSDSPESYLKVFKGLGVPPYFDFKSKENLYFSRRLPYATPDVEVVDVNQDGVADIYVIQTDELSQGTYCGREYNNRDWWDKGNQAPVDFSPPNDTAPDLLFVGSSRIGKKKFTTYAMKHAEPGCGFLLEKFGNNRTLILAQGTNERPGHNLLLQWYL